MSVLAACSFCGGTGAVTYETGPAVEHCSQCRGTGRALGAGALRGVFTRLLDEKGVFLDADMRLLLVALADLESRVHAIEMERR